MTGLDCDSCRNGVHADCAGNGCGCLQRACDLVINASGDLRPITEGALNEMEAVVSGLETDLGQEDTSQRREPAPRLLAQWVAVPGDITDMLDPAAFYAETVDTLIGSLTKAHQMLAAVAAKEGKRLLRPVMCRVVVEAFTEDQ